MSPATQNALKWLAIATMLVDHVGALLLPEAFWLRVVGRVAWPLFALLVGVNLGARGVPAARYLPRLAVWAVPSQVAFLLVGWSDLNIMVTLALGVIVWGVLRGEFPRWWLGGLALAPWTQYGVLGVLLVPLLAAAVMRRRWHLAGLGLLTVLLSQGSFFWGFAAALAVACAGAVLAIAAAVGRELSRRHARTWLTVPRVPRQLGYAFYPLHLLLLVGLRAVAPAVPA